MKKNKRSAKLPGLVAAGTRRALFRGARAGALQAPTTTIIDGGVQTLEDLFKDAFKKRRRATFTKAFATYLVGIVGLLAAYRVGFLQEVVKAAGWVAYAVAVLVVIHVAAAFRSILGPTDDPHVDWLAKIDSTILTVGFLGKLYAIAVVVGAASGATDPTAIAAGISAINHGISQALFSTMAGLGVAAWTHCVTLIVAHKRG